MKNSKSRISFSGHVGHSNEQLIIVKVGNDIPAPSFFEHPETEDKKAFI